MTVLNDAIVKAASLLERTTRETKAIVVLSTALIRLAKRPLQKHLDVALALAQASIPSICRLPTGPPHAMRRVRWS